MSWKYFNKGKVNKERQYELLRSPVITEKATLGSEHNQVTFRVPLDATKPEIRSAVEQVFDVKVVAVNCAPRMACPGMMPITGSTVHLRKR